MSEAELREYNLQLESVEAALKADPDNDELKALIDELKEIIQLTESVLAEQNGGARHSANSTSPPHSSRHTPTVANYKRDAPGTPVDGGQASSTYAVGDNVLARWTSGDNQLYPARITSVMGSQKNPVYIVKFTQYNATESLQPKDIKPAGNANKKRKLDNSPVPGSSTPQPLANGAIISQPAAINAEFAEARKEKKADDSQKPVKKGRKIEAKKVLEQGQKKWQDFAAKGVKGKGAGKPKRIGEASMFRTPESVTGRVGFTGSGQAMRKDVARSRHIYQQADDEE